jgi:hypothetical protein
MPRLAFAVIAQLAVATTASAMALERGCDLRHDGPTPLIGALTLLVAPVRGLDVATELESHLVTEVRELGRFRVVGDGPTRGVDPRACRGELHCLALAARSAGARYLLTAVLLAEGPDRQLMLSLVDVTSVRAVDRVVDDLPDEPLARARVLRRLAVRLLAPESYVGALRLTVAPGADVELDGRSLGSRAQDRRLDGIPAGPHHLIVRTPTTVIDRLVDVPFHGELRIRVDAERDVVRADTMSVEAPEVAGAVDLSSLEPGIQVRVDGDVVAITDALNPLVPVHPGTRRLRLSKQGLGDTQFVLEVGPRELHPVRVAAREGELSVTVDASHPLGDGRHPLAEVPRSLPAQVLLANADAPAPHPLSREGIARAAALAGFGYLAAELHRFDPQPTALRAPPLLAPERRWAIDGMFITNSTRVHLPHGFFEWAGVAGTGTLLVAAVSMVAHDLFASAGPDPEASATAAATLLQGFRFSLSDGAGWIRFGAPL